MSPKWPIYPNQNFFRKPVDKPCSFHSRLHTSQKSKWDINLLMKYWWLMNTEISLAEHHFWLTWEPDFSQACSFHRTLMSHKNFCFTQIPDKTNDVIFWKSLIFLFLGYFWLFLSDGDFFQKIWNCHERLLWVPKTMLSFRKKLISQFWEKLQTEGRTHERTDRRMDGQTLFHRTLLGGPKRVC